LKALFENYLKLSIIFLKNFFEKDQVSKYYFVFIQTYASYLAKRFIKFAMPKECFTNIFQKLFL
jgi:hypothetical protein